MHYNNIEIGTSDFKTLIESADGNGISIEAVPCYYNNLPNRKGWEKLNFAISDENKIVKVYWVNPEKITIEPVWVRGCNSINKPHPTIERMFPHLVDVCEVECITMFELFSWYDIESVDYLKIDTEGHDTIILKDYLRAELPLAKKIQFESNILTPPKAYQETVELLKEKGYRIQKNGFDTICNL